MTEGWVKIFSTAETFKAKLAEDLLKQHGIESHIASKPDSVLPMLGMADLYVPADLAEQAVVLLQAEWGEEEE